MAIVLYKKENPGGNGEFLPPQTHHAGKYLQTNGTYAFWANILTNACNVKAFGATGDGITDDTAAIQTALNSCQNIYIPAGVYIVSNLTVSLNNTMISGDGPGSVLRFKLGSTGPLLNTGNNAVNIHHLTFFGGNDTSKFAAGSSLANRSGISIFTQVNSIVDSITVYGFENIGVLMADATRDRDTHLVFTNSSLYNNFIGLLAGPNNAEYIRVGNLDIHNNATGLMISSGNITVDNSKITDNGIGVHLIGTAIINNGHGNINGSIINHNTFAIKSENVTIGFNFIGCNIFYGIIHLINSTGIMIQNCILDLNDYYLQGGGINYIRNNFIYNGQSNTITHSYSGSADNTKFVDNVTPAETFLDDTKAVVTVDGSSALYGTTPRLNIGASPFSGNFGFIGYDTAGNYVYIGHSYGAAFNKNIVIANNGNVGIGGDTSPNALLSVGNTSQFQIDTNGRILKRITSATSTAAPSFNANTVDMYILTALAVDITSFTVTGTPVPGQELWIAITGTAARAITWGSSFESSTVILPNTTVGTNRLDVRFIWNSASSKWRCISVA